MVIEDTWQLSKQVSKLFFQMRAHVYFLLGQTETSRSFLEGAGRGRRAVQGEITPKST